MESHRVRHDLTTKQQHHNVKSMGVTYTAAAKSLQSCPTLCDPIDGSPPGSPVAGILQARTLEWVVISFSNAWKWSCSVVSNSSRPHGLQRTRLLPPWDFPGKSTGVGCHHLLRWLILNILIKNISSQTNGVKLWLPYIYFLICPPLWHITGEGNGNPLQYSCLENPRDGGAWWAAIYGVAQSWKRLRRLSRSSNAYIWNLERW